MWPCFMVSDTAFCRITALKKFYAYTCILVQCSVRSGELWCVSRVFCIVWNGPFHGGANWTCISIDEEVPSGERGNFHLRALSVSTVGTFIKIDVKSVIGFLRSGIYLLFSNSRRVLVDLIYRVSQNKWSYTAYWYMHCTLPREIRRQKCSECV